MHAEKICTRIIVLLSGLIFLLLFPSTTTVAATAPSPIKVLIGGEEVKFGVHPIIENNTTLVQFRPVFEKLGLEIEWDQETKTITGSDGYVSIELKIDVPIALLNGFEVSLPVAPKIINGNTMVPLRFVGEAANRDVTYESKTRIITIDKDVEIGKLYYPGGILAYEGELKDGEILHGRGKLYKLDGTLWYDAEFIDGEVAYGTLYYPDNHKVVGSFLDGAPYGKGKYYLDNGQVWYDGEFLHGMKHGQGKFYHYESGVLIYDGEWQYNLRHGYGIEYANHDWKTTIEYEGYFQDDKYHGQGKKRSGSFNYLVAEYVNGKANGPAYETDQYGVKKLEGTAVNGRFEGKGKQYHRDGYADIVFKDNYIQSGIVYDSEGNVLYEGTFNGFYPDDERVEYYMKWGRWPD